MPSEETPLIDDHARNYWAVGSSQDVNIKDTSTFHDQFCKLVGIPPSDLPEGQDPPPIGPKTLYGRALKMKRKQSTTYAFTASISNTLLLTQVVLGAAVTGLGASESSHVLITLFGALNTIIAGVVAYLKSRGQPMRARMYRDDLERVVDEIENSEIMWLGISKKMHGYTEINTDVEVTVRSEVARLTRLYDRAIRTNSMNNPDMYMSGGGFEYTNLALRKGALPSGPILPPAVPQIGAAPAAAPTTGEAPEVPVALPAVVDPDASPATAPNKPPPKDDNAKDQAAKSSASSSKSDGKAPAESSKESDAKEPDATGGASDDKGTTVHDERPAAAGEGKT